MGTVVFVCTDCTKKHDLLKWEQYALGYVGIHRCQICEREVDTSKERYNCFSKTLLEKIGLVVKISCN